MDIAGVIIDDVWDTVCEFELYPRYMADVVEIRFLERTEHEGLSSWRVLLNGSELTWDEKDYFTPPHRVDFEQTDGDLEVFRGSWTLEESGDVVTVTLEIEFDLGIPSLAAVLDPIGVQAIHSNARSMLTAISERRTVAATP